MATKKAKTPKKKVTKKVSHKRVQSVKRPKKVARKTKPTKTTTVRPIQISYPPLTPTRSSKLRTVWRVFFAIILLSFVFGLIIRFYIRKSNTIYVYDETINCSSSR